MERHAPARRLHELLTMIDATGGITVYDAMDRLGVCRHTVLRGLAALQRAGEPLYEEMIDGKKVWRLMPSARGQTVRMTVSQVVAFFLSRCTFEGLAGTGFKEDLDEVFTKLEATLKRKDVELAKNLERKVFAVNEAPHVYEGAADHVDDIVTALLKEERLDVRHATVDKGTRTFVFEPWTLLLYRRGLYLVGFCHHHDERRTLSLGDFREVTWKRGDKFDYPAKYQPSAIVEGAFGLFRGEAAHVRIRFEPKVARYVVRRQWHPTQKIKKAKDGGVELAMTVAGTTEVVSWILGWGEQAEVLEPPSLRAEIADVARKMAARYAGEAAPA